MCRRSQTIEAKTFCMVSLYPELSKLFSMLMSTSGPYSSQNGKFANCPKHESKIEDSLWFFSPIIIIDCHLHYWPLSASCIIIASCIQSRKCLGPWYLVWNLVHEGFKIKYFLFSYLEVLSNQFGYTMIVLKCTNLKRYCSACIYPRRLHNVSSKRPCKTVLA